MSYTRLEGLIAKYEHLHHNFAEIFSTEKLTKFTKLDFLKNFLRPLIDCSFLSF